MIGHEHLDVITWTDQTSLLLAPYATIGRLDDPADWKSWAREANDASSIRKLLPPDPENYEVWQDWADRFNKTISELGV